MKEMFEIKYYPLCFFPSSYSCFIEISSRGRGYFLLTPAWQRASVCECVEDEHMQLNLKTMNDVMTLILRLIVRYYIFCLRLPGLLFLCPAAARRVPASITRAALCFTDHCSNLSLLIISIQSSCGCDGHEFFPPRGPQIKLPPACPLPPPAWCVHRIVLLFVLFSYFLRDLL